MGRRKEFFGMKVEPQEFHVRNKKVASIAGATITVAVGMIFSNVLGFAKSLLLAKYFGISAELDAYYIAIIPPMVLTWLVTGAMQSSIIPVFMEYKIKGDENDGFTIFRSFFTIAFIFFLSLSLCMFFLSDTIISIIAPGFRDDRFKLASTLLKIVSPIVLLGGISDLITGLFNANKKFTIPAFGAAISLMISITYLVLFKTQGIYALAIGIVAGAVVQCIYTLMGAKYIGFKLKIDFELKSEGVRKILLIMLPMLFGLSFSHANIIVDQIMASLLPKGSIAALNYANSINDVISQLFILSIGSAILPFFSQLVAEGKIDQLKETYYTAVRMAAFVLIPLTVLVIILGSPAVQIVFERGAFDRKSTEAVSGAWKAFSLGLFTFATNVITARAITSFGRTKFLAAVAFASIFINVTLNFILMKSLYHVGIALSTSATSAISSVLLIYLFYRLVGRLQLKNILFPVIRISIYSFITGLFVFAASYLIDITKIYGILLVGIAGLASYVLLAWLTKLQELKILLGPRFSQYMRIGT